MMDHCKIWKGKIWKDFEKKNKKISSGLTTCSPWLFWCIDNGADAVRLAALLGSKKGRNFGQLCGLCHFKACHMQKVAFPHNKMLEKQQDHVHPCTLWL